MNHAICQGIILSGQNRGNPCQYRARYGNFCGHHRTDININNSYTCIYSGCTNHTIGFLYCTNHVSSRLTVCEFDGCLDTTFGVYCHHHEMIANIDYYLQAGIYANTVLPVRPRSTTNQNYSNRYSTPELVIDDIINMTWGPRHPTPIRRHSNNTTPLKTKILQKVHDDNCSICFETMEAQTTVYDLKCKHLFHTKCLDEWRNHKNTCPLDRSKIE